MTCPKFCNYICVHTKSAVEKRIYSLYILKHFIQKDSKFLRGYFHIICCIFWQVFVHSKRIQTTKKQSCVSFVLFCHFPPCLFTFPVVVLGAFYIISNHIYNLSYITFVTNIPCIYSTDNLLLILWDRLFYINQILPRGAQWYVLSGIF